MMRSKIVHSWDQDFSYKEDVEIFPNEVGEFEIPENCTDVPLPQPNWKPIFDTEKNKWIETITQDELDELQKPSERPLTDTEILGQQMTDFEIRLLESEVKNHV